MPTVCNVCHHARLKTVLEYDKYRILQCSNCKFGILEPYPTIEKANLIYSPDYFDDKKTPDFIKDAERKFRYVDAHISCPSRILDFGCGVGDFIGVAQNGGHEMCGYDVSEHAIVIVRQTYNIKAHTPPLREDLFPKENFEAIVAFDVIEHLPNFREALHLFNIWLKNSSENKLSGKVFLTMPNIASWDTKLMGKYSYGYKKIPQHINYFSPQSISIVAREAGFEVDEIKLWGFERSLDFVFSKLKLEALRTLSRKLGISNLTFYYPMHDMMVTLSKTNE